MSIKDKKIISKISDISHMKNLSPKNVNYFFRKLATHRYVYLCCLLDSRRKRFHQLKILILSDWIMPVGHFLMANGCKRTQIKVESTIPR